MFLCKMSYISQAKITINDNLFRFTLGLKLNLILNNIKVSQYINFRFTLILKFILFS